MRKIAIAIAKYGLMVALLGFLFWQASENDAFGKLQQQSKNWWLLGLALVATVAAVTTTLVRWHLLLRATGIPCRLGETLRIGYVGFLFNLVPAGGVVAGDVIKAVMMARHHQNQFTKAFAATFVDRVLGLYVLFLMGLAAIYATGFHQLEHTYARIAHYSMLGLSIATTIGLVAVLMPDLTGGASLRQIGRLPRVGPSVRKAIEAVRLYRDYGGVLVVASLMSVLVHAFLAVAIFLIAAGLYEARPSLASHFVLGPVSFATGAIPLAAGPFEAVLDNLYPCMEVVGRPMAGTSPMGPGQGLVIALCYRVITLVVAMVGVFYYFAGRAEIRRMVEEAKKRVEEDAAEWQEPELMDDRPSRTDSAVIDDAGAPG